MNTVKIFVLAVITISMLIFTNHVYAAQCKLPKGCKYLDSEFSSGGGNKHSYLMEVTCLMPDGTITKYIDWKLSVGSMLNMGRFTAPKKIKFISGTTDKLTCKF